MKQNSIVLFVCEHGAAKSILAAAYFNKLASERGSDLRAIARGTNPDGQLSQHTITGLGNDGLQPAETTPQKLTEVDLQNTQRVITFCDLPVEYQQPAVVEHWQNIPPVSENYEKARDIIIERIRHLLNH
jgi:protein-tyrosine-phosphatase